MTIYFSLNDCDARGNTHKLYSVPATHEQYFKQMGYICPNCRKNAVSMSTWTCKRILAFYRIKL